MVRSQAVLDVVRPNAVVAKRMHIGRVECPRLAFSPSAKETSMGIQGRDRQIDNIEFNVVDIARSKAFYGRVFGWTFVDYGATYSEFSGGRMTGGFTTGEPGRTGG